MESSQQLAITKTLGVSAELFLAFLRHPVPPGLTAEGLPDDAVIVGATFMTPPLSTQNIVVLEIASATFTEPGDLEVKFYQNAAGAWRGGNNERTTRTEGQAVGQISEG